MTQPAPNTQPFNNDELHDFVVAHGYGAPTQAGYDLGKTLMANGDDYATAAAEIAFRGLTEPVEDDEDE